MKNRKFSTLSLLVLISMLLGAFLYGCGPAATQAPADEPAAEEPAAEEPAAEEPAGEKVKIVYWSMFSEGEPLQQMLDAATDDFMAENPNIEVEIQWAGRNNLTQLQSALAAGTQVDIVDHSDDRVWNAIVVNDLALPLDKYLDEKAYDSDKTWRETFVSGALDVGKAEDGTIYLIPRDDYVSAFFYSEKQLTDMGITPKYAGMTWDEFKAMLAEIKSKDPAVSPLGADGNVPFYNNWWFTYLAIRLAGKDAFREAAYDKTGEKWGAPEFLQAAEMIRELQDAGYFQKGFEGSVWPAAQVQWVNGEIAMLFCGAWLPTEMAPQMPEGFVTGMFTFPNVEGGKGNDYVEHWANSYGVLAATKNPDAVALYLKFIMSMKNAEKIVALGSPVPLVGAPVPPSVANQFKIIEESTVMPARAGLNTEIPEYMDNVYNKCDDQFFQMVTDPAGFISCLKTESATYWANK